MSLRTTVGMVTAAIAVAASMALSSAPASAAEPTYYLSLGDSLAQGYQPGLGNTDQGYADDLYAVLHLTQPSLQLVKLGCTGETTGTMINGQHCSYGTFPSQLAAAESFLRQHPGQVRYVTIDIGGNDIDRCAGPTGIDLVCVAAGLQSVATDLPVITSGLRAAGDTTPTYVALNTYDPFLATWLAGPNGPAEATASVALGQQYNTEEAAVYGPAGFRIADLATAFDTTDFTHQVTVSPYGTVPANVAVICELTYMCSKGNIHPNPTGYAVIAATTLLATLSQ